MATDRRVLARFLDSGDEVRLLLPARLRERWRSVPPGDSVLVPDYLRGRVLVLTRTRRGRPEIVSDLCALSLSGEHEPGSLTERDVLDLLDPLS